MAKIQMQFGDSKSPNIRQSLLLAQMFYDFTRGESYQITVDPAEIFRRWEVFNQLFHMVRGWASFSLVVDGQLIPKTGYSDFFYGLQDQYYCQREKTQSEQPNFCKQFDWGCSQIRSMRLHPLEYDGGHYWYHYGHFRGRTWIVHKKEIEAALRKEISERHLDLCPFFSFDRIREEIELLPDEIDLRENKYFEATHRMKFVGGNIVEVPDGIQHRSDAVYRVNPGKFL